MLTKSNKLKIAGLFAFIAICFAMLFCTFSFNVSKKLQAYDETYEACVLDENQNLVQNFEYFADAISDGTLQEDYAVKVLKNEIYIQNQICVQFSFSIISGEPVTFYIENISGSVFEIDNGANLKIAGPITFDGNHSQYGLLNCQENSEVEIDGAEIKNFNCDNLIENFGEITLKNTKITDNFANVIINNYGNLEISSGSIFGNYLLSDDTELLTMYQSKLNFVSIQESFSFIKTQNDIVISGEVNLNIIVFLDRENENSCKIIRQNQSINSNTTNSAKIVLTGQDNVFKLHDLIVETNEFDDISYTLLGIPKINGQIDAYHLNLEQNGFVVRGAKFDVEYYINSATGYEILNDENLQTYYEYDASTTNTEYDIENCNFVGWFGYNNQSGNYYDYQNNTYASIFSNSLNYSTSIKSLSNQYLINANIYQTSKIIDGEEFFGKLYLYGKWSTEFTLIVQTQNENYNYVQSIDGGTAQFNHISLNQPFSMQQLTIGTNISFSAKAMDNYVFVGWFELNEENEYIKYGFENYEYLSNGTINLKVSNLKFGFTSLSLRFAYKSSVVSLQKIFIDEQNSTSRYDILAGNEYLNDAKLIRDGEIYEGTEYINFVGSQILLRDGDELLLQINPDINYKLFDTRPVDVKSISTQNLIFVSYELVGNKYFLTIKNNGQYGVYNVVLNFQKNFNIATLCYGTNILKNNFEGADANFAESIEINDQVLYPMFNFQTNTSISGQEIISKTGNVYFATDIIVMLNLKSGYRIETYDTVIEYQSLKDIEVVQFEYIISNNQVEGIKIFNVIDSVNISLLLSRVYSVSADVNVLNIDYSAIKIGQIKVDSDNFTNKQVTKIVKAGDSIHFETKQIDREVDYVFKSWSIKTLDEEIANYDILQISADDLLNTSLNLQNVYDDLIIEAIYGKKVFSVDIICPDTNGAVEAISGKTGSGYFWEVEYGDDITYKFTPKNKMYIFELKSCTDDNAKQTQTNTYTTIELKNITQNHRIEIKFVPDTIYRHMNIEQLEGDGTFNSPYLIKTANQLALVSFYVNNGKPAEAGKVNYNEANFRLENDIELNEKYFFVPIGSQDNPFNGLFNYNYNSISNIILEESSSASQDNGLFGVLDGNAKIIKQYRSSLPITIGISSIAVVCLVAFLIVFKIERKRQKPKKVFVLNVSDKDQNE